MVCIPFTLSQAHQTENTMTDDGSRAEEIRTASCSISCPYSGSILASYHITGNRGLGERGFGAAPSG